MLITSGLERIGDIHRPDDAAIPARRIIREEAELELVVDAEPVRAAAGHIEKAHLPSVRRRSDVEDIKSAARAFPGFTRERLGVHVEEIVADHPQFMHLDFRRRLELEDLLWLGRVAHVMNREAMCLFAVAGDRADIGEAFADLDQTPASPSRGRIVAEQAEIMGLFCAHSSLRNVSYPAGS